MRDTNAHANGDSYCNSDGYSDSYGYSDSNGDSNGDSDSNSDCYGHSNINVDADVHTWGRNTRAVDAGSACSDRSLRGLHGQRWHLCL